MMPADPFADIDPAHHPLPRELLARVQSPALVIYLDRVRANLDRVLGCLAGDPSRWRPHLKTVKMREVMRELAVRDVRHFKCATTREIDHLLRAMDEMAVTEADVLLAHPAVGPGLRRLGELSRRHPRARVSVLSEDPAHVAEVPPSLSIFVDVNPGMNRTGIPVHDAPAIRAVAGVAGARFRGVHFYDGHLHGLDPHTRRTRAIEAYQQLIELVRGLRGVGIAVEEVITSGTPTFRDALAHAPLGDMDVVHRVSPGTVVFHDGRSEGEHPDLGLEPAALVFTRLVSQPAPDIVTCDAGSKSIAVDAGDPCATVLRRPELRALTPSEEHLPLRVHGGAAPPRGTPLLLVPRHVCPTVNLADAAVLIDGGELTGIAPIGARGHDIGFEK